MELSTSPPFTSSGLLSKFQVLKMLEGLCKCVDNLSENYRFVDKVHSQLSLYIRGFGELFGISFINKSKN